MKVAVGLSGGVDSSVTAYLLQCQGYDVHGIFMRNWQGDSEQCQAEQDLRDAQSVAKKLQIPFDVVDFSETYWDKVFQHFLSELESGKTPSPDILCNQHVKFGVFFEHMANLGFDKMATGHYAKILDGCALGRADDRKKDQTYFLWSVPKERWAQVLFPLGSLLKTQVRTIAQEQGFATAEKKDSTGICFIGPDKFRTFIQQYLAPKKGPIISDCGQILGEHQGLFSYTLGQRSGLCIGGVQGTQEGPWYVVAKDHNSNTLIISQNTTHPLLYTNRLSAKQCYWQCEKNEFFDSEIEAKIRHGESTHLGRIEKNHFDANKISVTFHNPVRAITPGQCVVFYDNNRCLGGGWITSADENPN